jgi:hypothetical protein
MAYLLLLIVPLAAAAILYHRYRLTRSRPSDYEASDEFLAKRGLKRVTVTKGNTTGPTGCAAAH